jgi:phage terminase large subunit-like protein
LICAASHKTIVHQYIDDVLSGEIVACKLVKAACERHLRDLQRQNTDEFPFWFDEREADDVCSFFPLALRHSKGEKFAGNPLDLQPWQVFIMWVLFGWKRCDDNSRRFRRAHISVARKNGKSTVAAGIGLYGLTCDCEPGAEIYVSATKKDQAKCVFEEAERMRESSPRLKALVTSHVNNLFVKTSNSFFRPTSSDKPLDGPNPHMTIFDELHAWREVHRKFYNTMITGGGSRTQPLQVTITTAGDDQSFIWLEEYAHCTAVATGTINEETIFVYIAEIDDGDDPLDESVWMKANPNLGVSVSMEYMRQQARDAVNKPTFYSVFVSKHCNKITSSNEKAFDMDAWDKCAGTLSDWMKADAIGSGVDLGGRDDLASFGVVARFPIGEEDGKIVYRYEVMSESYIAENTPRDLTKQPFSRFIYEGFLTKAKYPQSVLESDLVEYSNTLGFLEVAYDPKGASGMAENLEQEGMTAYSMAQTQTMFNEPIIDFLQAVKDGRVTHDGNPLLRWAVNNAVLYKNRHGDVMFDKKSSAEKIDPIVSVVMAFKSCCRAPARAIGSLVL